MPSSRQFQVPKKPSKFTTSLNAARARVVPHAKIPSVASSCKVLPINHLHRQLQAVCALAQKAAFPRYIRTLIHAQDAASLIIRVELTAGAGLRANKEPNQPLEADNERASCRDNSSTSLFVRTCKQCMPSAYLSLHPPAPTKLCVV